MKLKSNTKVAKTNSGDYIFEGLKTARKKKITSRAFACLLGKNLFESKGKTILERCGFVEKESIDPYYTVRGAIGELLVKDYLIEMYLKYKKIKLQILSWNPKEVNFDNFPKNPDFGGLLDLAIPAPAEERAVVEVKSKSLKDLTFIDNKKGVEEEVLQGKFLGTLSKTPICHMGYIFFNEEQETLLRNFVKDMLNLGKSLDGEDLEAKNVLKALNWRYEHFKIKIYKHEIDFVEIENLMQESKETLNNSIQTTIISRESFTPYEQTYLDGLVYGKGYIAPQSNNDDDAPF